ncbi:MAG: AAA family ATPase [Sedimentisphaerales bacterium]|nr:AAA family ATPase [Sedimentisphaerales bacterium]
MISDVVIRNFKCFKSLTIPELGRITLISGRNNVGKTSLLEALFLFLDQRNPGMVLNQYSRRGIKQITLTTEAIWSPIFCDYTKDREILVSLAKNGTPEQITVRFNREFAPPPSMRLQPEEQQISTDEKLTTVAVEIEYDAKSGKKIILHHFCDPNNQNRPTVFSQTQPANIPLQLASFLSSKEHNPPDEIAKQFSILAKQDRENEAIEFLRIIEPRLERLKIIAEGPSSLVHGKLKGLTSTLPINFMGEGMEKLLALIVAITHSPNRVILLDEIENGLHYSIMPKIWKALGKALRKYDCQLITTTHSYECLQAAHEGLSEMPEDFRYIRLHRKDDEISAKLSNYDMIGTAIETNLEVR